MREPITMLIIADAKLSLINVEIEIGAWLSDEEFL